MHPQVAEKVLSDFSRFPTYKKRAILEFCNAYDFGKMKIKEARRSAKPMMDWCEQLGLVFRQGDWYFISDVGLKIQQMYSSLAPIWYHLLGDRAEFKAALILTYLAARKKSVKVPKKFLKFQMKGKLTSENVRDMLEDVQEQLGFKIFDPKFSLIRNVDFDFFYDIPIYKRGEVFSLYRSCLKEIRMPRLDLSRLEVDYVKNMEELIKGTTQEKSISKIGEILGFDIPRPELFKVPFEWTTCFLLRHIGYQADKYQGQFREYCGLREAEENPDIVIENYFTSLVECKSTGEWGALVKLDKRISGEILFYENYVETLKANSVLFVCEGRFNKKEFVDPVRSLLKRKAERVIMSTQAHLARALRDKEIKNELNEKIMNPKTFNPRERILI